VCGNLELSNLEDGKQTPGGPGVGAAVPSLTQLGQAPEGPGSPLVAIGQGTAIQSLTAWTEQL
jgi:hypothetical protein